MRAPAALTGVVVAALVAGCTTPPSYNFVRRTQEELAVQVIGEVCLPFVADGVAYEDVRRRLDFAWTEDLPELLTSGPPGPVFRQGFPRDTAVLSFTPGNKTRLSEWQGMRDCRINLKRSTPEAIRAAVAQVMATRPDFIPGRPVEREIAKYCARSASGLALRVHVLDAGASGVIAGVSQSRDPREGCE